MPPDLDFSATLEKIISKYRKVVGGVEKVAQDSPDGRAYGGRVRATKGKIVEFIAAQLVAIAWKRLGKDENRLSISSRKIPISIKEGEGYLATLPGEIAERVRKDIVRYVYQCKIDLHVVVDGKFVLGIECKAYAENAMLKRILVDFRLLKTFYPRLKCLLVQFESQLRGDYSSPLQPVVYGSRPTHTLMSYFPEVRLNIVTLLEGERHMDRPIHKAEFSKEMKKEAVEKAIATIQNLLREF